MEKVFLAIILFPFILLEEGRFLLSATFCLPCLGGPARSEVGVCHPSASGPLIDRLLSCSLQKKASAVCLASAKTLYADHFPDILAGNSCFSKLLRKAQSECVSGPPLLGISQCGQSAF